MDCMNEYVKTQVATSIPSLGPQRFTLQYFVSQLTVMSWELVNDGMTGELLKKRLLLTIYHNPRSGRV